MEGTEDGTGEGFPGFQTQPLPYVCGRTVIMKGAMTVWSRGTYDAYRNFHTSDRS